MKIPKITFIFCIPGVPSHWSRVRPVASRVSGTIRDATDAVMPNVNVFSKRSIRALQRLRSRTKPDGTRSPQ